MVAQRPIHEYLRAFGACVGALAALTSPTVGDDFGRLTSHAGLVDTTAALQTDRSTANRWSGRVVDTADPYLVLAPCQIDADLHKHLYVRISATAGSSLQLYFSNSGSFSELRSVRLQRMAADGRPHTHRFDLSDVESWTGVVRRLRLDIDGADPNTLVTLDSVAWSANPRDELDGEPVIASGTIAVWGRSAPRELRERMAGWHRTNVVIDELSGHAALLTYIRTRYTWAEHSLLAKLVPTVETAGASLAPRSATSLRVEDFPGGVIAECKLNETHLRTTFTPLCVGRGDDRHVGAAVYAVNTNPPTPVEVRIGGGGALQLIYGSDRAPLRKTSLNPVDALIAHASHEATFRSGVDGSTVAVRTDGAVMTEDATRDGQTLCVRWADGDGRLLLAFGDSLEAANDVAALDIHRELERVTTTYDALLRTRIETPEPQLDAAFRSAIYNLEYTWIEPYGWLECIHHWVSMWHMQAAAGAAWLGQPDRVRQSALAHAERLMPGGAAPQLAPFGQVHRDFGGSNQYFAWHLRRYWRHSGDRAFVRTVAPALDRVIAQTFEENDPDDNLLLRWGKQIGNQEDFVSTPGDGTTPSIEGIGMMRTRAEFADAINDPQTAARWRARAATATRRLRDALWMPDLGRYAYYVDEHGLKRLDGQYHALIYPLIYDLLDPLDGWTSVRHLTDRLIDDDGAAYCSNNFPEHVAGTWGMQAGAAQQPWAAWGLAAAGRRNDVAKPLLAAAGWTMDKNKRGAWPEISIESTPCYFSPPAGLFIAATVEALFGLCLDQPSDTLTISPAFPDAWPAAELHLPHYDVQYARTDDGYAYVVQSDKPLARRLRWRLPVGRVQRVRVNGDATEFSISPGVEHVILAVEAPPQAVTKFEIDFEPLDYALRSPGSLAEGDAFSVELAGLRIVGVDDRCGVLSETATPSDGTLHAAVRRGQLAPFVGYGRLGRLNFARRTFFLDCQADGVRCWLPVTLAVLPPVEAAPAGDIVVDEHGVHIELVVRNNAAAPLNTTARLAIAGETCPLLLDIQPRDEQRASVALPATFASRLALGDNRATLTLSDPPNALDLTLTAGEAFRARTELYEAMQARVQPCPLDPNLFVSDTAWKQMRRFDTFMHLPWAQVAPVMRSLADDTHIAFPELPHVAFEIAPRQFVPAAWKVDRPAAHIALGGEPCRKVYVLLVSFLSNHDMFAEVARISLRNRAGDTIYARTLRFPGDLDWFLAPGAVGGFATAHAPRKGRFDLLPLLAVADDDWLVGRPPAFPQPEFWAASRACITDAAVFNILEMDLGRQRDVDTLIFESLGVDPSFGVVAVSLESAQQGDLNRR